MGRTMEVATAVTDRLRALRLSRGWSQRRLARESDIPEADVSRIETGRLRPYSGQARRLARALRVRVRELFGPADDAQRAK